MYVDGSISDNGWAKSVTFCANTMRVIDGHGRLKVSLENKYKSVPVDVGWWTEQQGDVLLASLDPASNMAAVDGVALNSLTEMIIKKERGKKQTPKLGMIRDVNAFAKSITDSKKDHITIRQSKRSIKKIIEDTKRTNRDERESHSDDEYLFETERREDLLFPSDGNDYGIPDLLPSKIYVDTVQLPEDTFDRSNRSLLSTNYYCQGSRPFDSINHAKPIGGFLGFFTEDANFEKFYKQPSKWLDKLIDEQWTAVIEPDFSTYWDWPFALRLYSIYKSRWLARYWQTFGINIIPMLRRTNDFERDKWMYTSLPEKTPVAMMQLRMGGKKNQGDPDYWAGVGAVLDYAKQERGLEYVLFYAGDTLEKYVVGKIPEGVKYRLITPFINKRRPATQPQARGINQ